MKRPSVAGRPTRDVARTTTARLKCLRNILQLARISTRLIKWFVRFTLTYDVIDSYTYRLFPGTFSVADPVAHHTPLKTAAAIDIAPTPIPKLLPTVASRLCDAVAEVVIFSIGRWCLSSGPNSNWRRKPRSSVLIRYDMIASESAFGRPSSMPPELICGEQILCGFRTSVVL